MPIDAVLGYSQLPVRWLSGVRAVMDPDKGAVITIPKRTPREERRVRGTRGLGNAGYGARVGLREAGVAETQHRWGDQRRSARFIPRANFPAAAGSRAIGFARSARYCR